VNSSTAELDEKLLSPTRTISITNDSNMIGSRVLLPLFEVTARVVRSRAPVNHPTFRPVCPDKVRVIARSVHEQILNRFSPLLCII
jgi:hypothetical protein